MYIISGSLKRRKICFPLNSNIRPILMRIRATIFDVLQFRVPSEPLILDCFAGTGSLGFEAFSRWGGKLFFFENDKKIFDLLEKNILNLGVAVFTELLNINALKPPVTKSPMDLIFIDPPYASSHIIKDIIKHLLKRGWLKNGTIIVCATDKKHKLETPEYCEIFKETTMASSNISFFYVVLDNIIDFAG